VKALAKHGRDWELISKTIGTKSAIQNRNFYQNYRQKLGFDKILEENGHSFDDEKSDTENAEQKGSPQDTEELKETPKPSPAEPPVYQHVPTPHMFPTYPHYNVQTMYAVPHPVRKPSSIENLLNTDEAQAQKSPNTTPARPLPPMNEYMMRRPEEMVMPRPYMYPPAYPPMYATEPYPGFIGYMGPHPQHGGFRPAPYAPPMVNYPAGYYRPMMPPPPQHKDFVYYQPVPTTQQQQTATTTGGGVVSSATVTVGPPASSATVSMITTNVVNGTSRVTEGKEGDS
jgi:hypothetical protein